MNTSYLKKYLQNPSLNKLLIEAKARLKPAVEYFKTRTAREQQILVIGGIILIIMTVFFIVTAAIDFQSSLEKDYAYMQTYRLDAEQLIKEFKEVSKITPNDFSPVKLTQVKEDVIQALEVKEPEVILIDKKLTIDVPNTQFIGVMNLLNQLRKSYGLYPNKIKITRLSNSGYVAFNASFNVEQE